MIPARPPPEEPGWGRTILVVVVVLTFFLALGLLQAWTGAPLLVIVYALRLLTLFHH